MKLIPSTPVTIHAARHGFRWFPTIFRHVDGTLLLYCEYTYDAHFGPVLRLRSHDNGHTWIEDEENVPRVIWAHGFADGEFFELDSYGFRGPKDPNLFWYYAAWSRPGDPQAPVRTEFAKLRATGKQCSRFCDWQRSFLTMPTHPWWRLLNYFELGEEKALAEEKRLMHPPVPKAFDTGENILIGGPFMTGGIEVDGRLLTVGYAFPEQTEGAKTSVYLWESADRGRTWSERGVVGHGSDNPRQRSEGFNEASLVQLKDGRLYSVMRGGEELHHAWSSDMGRTWTRPEPVKLIDSKDLVRRVWPVCVKLADGTLVLAYGRPYKNLIFDPSGTGTQWQGKLDMHKLELATQEANGVPPHLRLRGDTTGDVCVRQWDSGDYVFLTAIGPRELLAGYDVQIYVEKPGMPPVSGIRMVRVRLAD